MLNVSSQFVCQSSAEMVRLINIKLLLVHDHVVYARVFLVSNCWFVTVVQNLASAYNESGNVYEAINMYQQALDLMRRVLPHNDISIGQGGKLTAT